MKLTDFQLPFDLYGNKASNLRLERHTVTKNKDQSMSFIVPRFGPIHPHSIKIKHLGTGKYLKANRDFSLGGEFKLLRDEHQVTCFGFIIITDITLDGEFEIEFQALGGDYNIDQELILKTLVGMKVNPRTTSWEDLDPDTVWETFPPTPHGVDLKDIYYLADLIFSNQQIRDAITGDLSPIHKHAIESITGLQEALNRRVSNDKAYKVNVADTAYLPSHYGPIAIAIPAAVMGRCDLELTVSSHLGMCKINMGGIVTADNVDWEQPYANSTGGCPATTVTLHHQPDGTPYVWVGDENTSWKDSNIVLSYAMVSSREPEKLTEGWALNLVTRVPHGTKQPIKAGGMDGNGLVPVSRKICGHTLEKDLVLVAKDVKALPVDANGKVVDRLTFASDSKAALYADDVRLLELLDTVLRLGSTSTEIIFECTKDKRPKIKIGDKTYTIMHSGDPEIGGGNGDVKNLVPITREINGYQLDNDIVLVASDVAAFPCDDEGVSGIDLIFGQGKGMLTKLGNKTVTNFFLDTTIPGEIFNAFGDTGYDSLIKSKTLPFIKTALEEKMHPLVVDEHGLLTDGARGDGNVTLKVNAKVRRQVNVQGDIVEVIGLTSDGTSLGDTSATTTINSKDKPVVKYDNGGAVKETTVVLTDEMATYLDKVVRSATDNALVSSYQEVYDSEDPSGWGVTGAFRSTFNHITATDPIEEVSRDAASIGDDFTFDISGLQDKTVAGVLMSEIEVIKEPQVKVKLGLTPVTGKAIHGAMISISDDPTKVGDDLVWYMSGVPTTVGEVEFILPSSLYDHLHDNPIVFSVRLLVTDVKATQVANIGQSGQALNTDGIKDVNWSMGTNLVTGLVEFHHVLDGSLTTWVLDPTSSEPNSLLNKSDLDTAVQTLSLSLQTVEEANQALTARVAELETDKTNKDATIEDLIKRIEALEA